MKNTVLMSLLCALAIAVGASPANADIVDVARNAGGQLSREFRVSATKCWMRTNQGSSDVALKVQLKRN